MEIVELRLSKEFGVCYAIESFALRNVDRFCKTTGARLAAAARRAVPGATKQDVAAGLHMFLRNLVVEFADEQLKRRCPLVIENDSISLEVIFDELGPR